MKSLLKLLGVSPILFGISMAYAEPTGLWLTEGGRSVVNIADCAPEGQPQRVLCSKIIWLKEPFNKDGELLRDKRNKDRDMQGRPILGMPILMNLRQVESNTWDGQVYNPEDGKVYRAQIIAETPKTLTVKGCAKVLFNWICKSRTWERASNEMLASDMPLEPRINEEGEQPRQITKQTN